MNIPVRGPFLNGRSADVKAVNSSTWTVDDLRQRVPMSYRCYRNHVRHGLCSCKPTYLHDRLDFVAAVGISAALTRSARCADRRVASPGIRRRLPQTARQRRRRGSHHLLGVFAISRRRSTTACRRRIYANEKRHHRAVSIPYMDRLDIELLDIELSHLSGLVSLGQSAHAVPLDNRWIHLDTTFAPMRPGTSSVVRRSRHADE